MPTPTYVALAKTVLTGSQATITFSGISNAYTDLVFLVSVRDDLTSSGAASNITISINGSSANGSATELYAGGTTVASARLTNLKLDYHPTANATANTFSNGTVYIPNYAGSTNKVLSAENVAETNSATANLMAIDANLWSQTAAITSITFTPASGNFVSGSRIDLYGIKNS